MHRPAARAAIIDVRLCVKTLEMLSLEERSTVQTSRFGTDGLITHNCDFFSGLVEIRDAAEKFSIILINVTFLSASQPYRIFDHRIQYRLNIRGRTGNDSQNFTRRSLLLQ